MPTFGENAYDSEWLAAFAGMALEAGRLEMAEAVVRLALQARRMEHANPPAPAYTGPQLVRPVPDPPIAAVTFGTGPTGDGDRDLQHAEAAATAIMARNVPESDRCAALDLGSSLQAPCDQPIYLETRDVNGNPVTPFWLHVDPQINTHHDAVPHGPRTFGG